MSAAARLAAFGVALAVVFLAAAALGRAVGPLEREVDHAHDEAAERGGHGAEGERELSVELVGGPPLRYRVVRPDGQPVLAYDVVHARPMHLILVRRDLAHFQHLHPRRGPGGTWFVPLALPAPGTYTAFADFSTRGERQTLQFDVNAPGAYEPEPLPAPTRVATTGPYRIELHGDVDAGRLSFSVTRGGRAVRVEPYLGARGHLVALRERDLHYLHVHAEEGRLAFESDFPSSGRYRLFLQFKAAGVVRTVGYAVEVGP